MYILKTTLELGCLYAPVAMALFLSFRILNIADMTTDGCFILSGAVSVMCALHGHPVAGIFLGMLAEEWRGVLQRCYRQGAQFQVFLQELLPILDYIQ